MVEIEFVEALRGHRGRSGLRFVTRDLAVAIGIPHLEQIAMVPVPMLGRVRSGRSRRAGSGSAAIGGRLLCEQDRRYRRQSGYDR